MMVMSTSPGRTVYRLSWRYFASLIKRRVTPAEFVRNRVVDSEHGNPVVGEFTVEELAANGPVRIEPATDFATPAMSVIAFRIGGGVAEEVEEEGLGEGVELGEGGAALGPQRLRPVQHLRNPPLLRQRRQGNFNFRCAGLRELTRVVPDHRHGVYIVVVQRTDRDTRVVDVFGRTENVSVIVHPRLS